MDIAASSSILQVADSSPADRAAISAPSFTNRSRVTNGTRLLEGIDKRSATGRRFRDLCQSYAEPLGGLSSLGAADAALVKEAAAKTVLSEQMAAVIARGESVDAEQAVRIGNMLQRLLSRLERRAKAVAAATPKPWEVLQAYLEARQQETAADDRDGEGA